MIQRQELQIVQSYSRFKKLSSILFEIQQSVIVLIIIRLFSTQTEFSFCSKNYRKLFHPIIFSIFWKETEVCFCEAPEAKTRTSVWIHIWKPSWNHRPPVHGLNCSAWPMLSGWFLNMNPNRCSWFCFWPLTETEFKDKEKDNNSKT